MLISASAPPSAREARRRSRQRSACGQRRRLAWPIVHVRKRRGRDVDAQVAGADRGRRLQTAATAAAADIHEQLAGRQLDLMGITGELAARGAAVRCRLRRVLIAEEFGEVPCSHRRVGFGEYAAEHHCPVTIGGVGHTAKPGTPGMPGLGTFDLAEEPEVVAPGDVLDNLPGHPEQVDELPPDTLAGRGDPGERPVISGIERC
jgi:hypothetical protein